ncbi:hypothetical protein UB45_16535 [Terrabacter sp. 28]|nr:hypothetical protein UB45_16535 [Terrabacter sp. 28]
MGHVVERTSARHHDAQPVDPSLAQRGDHGPTLLHSRHGGNGLSNRAGARSPRYGPVPAIPAAYRRSSSRVMRRSRRCSSARRCV